jgi:16S rRNA (guanine527-N7)-methyltransferase
MSNRSHHSADPVPLETIAATLAPFRVPLAQEQLRHFQEYLALLLQWNKSINLTALEDPVEILSRHFGESIFAASFLKLGESRLADVGTGAGFPGLPLKIASPGLQLVLFESNSKKRAFLTAAVQRLELADVRIVRGRYEEFDAASDRFDFVCARALGDYPIFLPWSARSLKPGGQVVLWLGTEDSIRISRRKEFFWDVPIPIPESRRRVIMVGRSSSECFT